MMATSTCLLMALATLSAAKTDWILKELRRHKEEMDVPSVADVGIQVPQYYRFN